MVLTLFIYSEQESILFLVLKGLATGGLVVVFLSFAFPQFLKINSFQINQTEDLAMSQIAPSFSTGVKEHYQRLILQVIHLVKSINSDFSAAIYMIDSDNEGYTCQAKSSPSFSEFIQMENAIVHEVLGANDSSIFKKSNKNNGWEDLLGEKTWRGSETIMGFPISYLDSNVGCLLVYADHFSSINDRDQNIVDTLSQFITHGMEDLERMELLMVDNYFNARIANLFDHLEVKSDESELFESIRGLCRAFFEYDKLTIVFSNKEKHKAVIKLVDGLHECPGEGEEFYIQNSLHGLVIQDDKTFCSNSWFDEFPEMNRFKAAEKDEFNFMSVLSIPLKTKKGIIGAITLERLKSKLYSKTDVRLLQLLCGTVSSILNWQKEYKKVHLTSIHDGLTGLLNHKAFLDRFEEEISRAERFNQSLGLVVLDLDKFKKVNDSYGHLYGDYVLQEVSRILLDNVRTIDVVGRYGGEEFAILLVNTDIKRCVPLASRIVKAIAAKTFLSDGIAIKITISAGMAGFPTHADQVRELIYKADKAMYQTKSEGGNNVSIWNA
jgi:diguanylate cyclase (GGDEF)-like protein